jgi:hypothetical protein
LKLAWSLERKNKKKRIDSSCGTSYIRNDPSQTKGDTIESNKNKNKKGRNERKKSEGMKNTNQLGAVSCVCVCDFFGRLNKSFIQKGRRQKANPGKKRKRK